MSDIQERTDTKEKKKSWSVGSLFWGLLLVLIGGLALASNFGWADVHWVNVWMLWPLVIVAIGLSVLSIRNLAWKITTLIFAVLTVAFIAYVALGDFSSPVTLRTYEISKEVENNDIKSVQVKVVAGTGTINITSADQSEVVKAKLESDIDKLTDKSSISGNRQTFEISMDSLTNWRFGNLKSNLNITLSRSIPTDFSIDFGAATADIDLSQVMASDIAIKTGASSMNLTLGRQVKTTNMSLDSGASTIVIRVPSDSGLRVSMDGGLVSKDMATLLNKGNGIYESLNYGTADKIVNIVTKIGAATFRIELY